MRSTLALTLSVNHRSGQPGAGICSFQHRLLHEHGWSIRRETDAEISWFHPDGMRYRAGPSLVAAAGSRPTSRIDAARPVVSCIRIRSLGARDGGRVARKPQHLGSDSRRVAEEER